jgi:hypothetical protein
MSCVALTTGDTKGAGGCREVPGRGGEIVRDGARAAAAVQVAALVRQPEHDSQRVSGGDGGGVSCFGSFL